MTSLTSVAAALRHARQAMGVSQRDIAKRAGLTQAQISKIENGGDLTVSSLVELARALGLELALVPLKVLPAVEGLTRTATSEPASVETRRRLKQLRQAIDAFSQSAPGEPVTHELQRLTDMLEHVVLPPGIDNALARLTNQVTRARLAVQKSPRRSALSKIRDLMELRATAQFIRDMVAMAQHSETIAKPAYALDDADE